MIKLDKMWEVQEDTKYCRQRRKVLTDYFSYTVKVLDSSTRTFSELFASETHVHAYVTQARIYNPKLLIQHLNKILSSSSFTDDLMKQPLQISLLKRPLFANFVVKNNKDDKSGSEFMQDNFVELIELTLTPDDPFLSMFLIQVCTGIRFDQIDQIVRNRTDLFKIKKRVCKNCNDQGFKCLNISQKCFDHFIFSKTKSKSTLEIPIIPFIIDHIEYVRKYNFNIQYNFNIVTLAVYNNKLKEFVGSDVSSHSLRHFHTNINVANIKHRSKFLWKTPAACSNYYLKQDSNYFSIQQMIEAIIDDM